MSRTALLLIATGNDWWRHPTRQAIARKVFEVWWQGAATAVLLPASAKDTGLPVAVERSFRCPTPPRPTPALRFWLFASGIDRIVVAGPGTAELAERLGRYGYAVASIGTPLPAAAAPPPVGLPLRIA